MEPYYQLLKEKFPTKSAVLTELINLRAIQHLPKGTEYFLSDLHGEYAAFDYILRNGSGVLKEKVRDCFKELGIQGVDVDDFCLYLYYPEAKLERESGRLTKAELTNRLLALIPIMIQVVQYVGSKYTRSKLRKTMPKEFAYIIEELLSEDGHQKNKQGYVQAILDTVASLGQLDELFVALAYLIQDLLIDHLHIVGDIFDRGAKPDAILDRLMQVRSVDIQWGNHDVTWMGALSGSLICMVNVIRIAARYNNLDLIEDRYGINLRRLIAYSQAHYEPVAAFAPVLDEGNVTQEEANLLNQLQQATAILQFKLEEQLINRRPDFQLEHRLMLSRINYNSASISLDGQVYPLQSFNSNCINVNAPSRLSQEEEQLLQQLMRSFQSSERLKRHVDFLFAKGSMYLTYNQELLYHGCIPLHENGDLKSLRITGTSYSGKALLDFYEDQIRQSYRHPDCQDDLATDLFWYLWVGECSSLFGKKAMTTFERYYIADKDRHTEVKNPYFTLRNQASICQMILAEFGLGEDGHIINGHTPVIEKRGENPVKADGKMLVIDGGMAKGYQKKTGIAGYTLVSNSYGLQLVAHQPFTNVEDVLDGGCDIVSTLRLVEEAHERKLVANTTIGHKLQQEIIALEKLYEGYEGREGLEDLKMY